MGEWSIVRVSAFVQKQEKEKSVKNAEEMSDGETQAERIFCSAKRTWTIMQKISTYLQYVVRNHVVFVVDWEIGTKITWRALHSGTPTHLV